ncbi:bacteriophage T4 gp5 trimerisation domain-containing protein [Ketobacter sp.]
MRIDDKKHQEQIYVHAQKDLDYYIRNVTVHSATSLTG